MRNIRHSSHMLDAGCGSGVYSFTLATDERVRYIDAIDMTKECIHHAAAINTFPHLAFQIADLTRLNFVEESFDLVLCSDVLEHVEDDEKAFSELAHILKKGGILLLTTPRLSDESKATYADYGHVRPGYTPGRVQELCRRNGLSVLREEGYSCPLTERLSRINYRVAEIRVLVALLFYPLYFASLISDFIFRNGYGGLFFVISRTG
jgi:ubiquinone/menaquinone biosynthesis C-methylase UbiE